MKRFRLNALAGGLRAAVAGTAALLLTFGAASRASAQIQDFPAVAILDFNVNADNIDAAGMEDMGKMAAAAVRLEMARTGEVDVVPVETINRVMQELGYPQTPTDLTALKRIAQSLSVATIITGTVVDARVDDVSQGRQGRVLISIVMRDVASGLPINGAELEGKSGVRTSNVADSSLYSDALDTMAFTAVQQMAQRRLPSATVLNTIPGQALINRGSRSGFMKGMEVIIVRGKTQVGNGTVIKVDADSAFIGYGRLLRGVQPGDKVRTLYTATGRSISLVPNGGVKTKRGSRGGSNSGLVSLLLVVLVLAFLLGQGSGSNTDLASVRAQAMVTAADQPAVLISWTRDKFLRGNQEGPFKWQVWRDDASTTPIAVADGSRSNVIDDALGTNHPIGANGYHEFPFTGGTECADIPDTSDGDGVLLVPGTPYQYSVEVVYRVSGLSIPGQGTGTGGGTTGTTTGGLTTGGTTGTTTGGTTGGTTGATTGGTGGQEQEFCYFLSTRVFAPGTATPLPRPELRSPDPGATVSTPITFQFASVRGGVLSVKLTYVVQLSISPSFPSGTSQTVTLAPFIELIAAGGQTVSSPTIDTSSFFPGANTVFWRVGVKNEEDRPGPVADASGKRFVYSAVSKFVRSIIPPGPGGGGPPP